MNHPKSRFLSARRIVIIISVILGLVHVILFGWTLQRRSASAELNESKLVLEENLDQLQRINQDQLDALRGELEDIQAEITALEASFPELGAPFAIYRRVLDLTQDSQLALLEISLVSSETLETASGLILKKDYRIETQGSLENCLDFLDNLEQAGLDTVSLKFASIIPAESLCSLEISTLGYPD
ncbi:MAG TPA: hypothetical protein ENG59_08780 [Chloroflexi bacterium]|nr:hypothetical protein [Chloroflexota bacterium]